MIILLGVTINFVKNGGLLERAKQASTQYQIEADREMLLADVVAALDIDGKVDKRMLNTLATADGFNISGEDFPITATSKSGNEFKSISVYKLHRGETFNEKAILFHQLGDVFEWIAILILSIVLIYHH